jgi:hypothetical protein
MAAELSIDQANVLVRAVRPLFKAPIRTGQGISYDASADGRKFLVNTLVGEPQPVPITLVVNWPALLQR